MIYACIMTAVWLIVIPTIIGFGILRIGKVEDKNFAIALIIGLLVEFVVYQSFSIPFTFAKYSFTLLTKCWMWTVIGILAISIAVNFYEFEIWSIIKKNFKALLKFPIILSLIVIMMIGYQCYHGFKYMFVDEDDSNFVGKANLAKTTDTLLIYDDTGKPYEEGEYPVRQIFSQFPHFTATISCLANIHPTILAHTIFPVIFIYVGYNVYYLLGKSIFKDDKEKVMTFMFIAALVILYGGYSRYSPAYRFLGRLWQGKNILVNIIMPFIMYLYLEHIGKERQLFYWFVLLLTLWGDIVLSSMAFTLPIIVSGILTLLYMIKDRKISYAFLYLICIAPAVGYGLKYLSIK